MSLSKYSDVVLDLYRVIHSKSSSLRQRREIGLWQIMACCTLQLFDHMYFKEQLLLPLMSLQATSSKGNYEHLKKNQEMSFGEVRNFKALRRGK